MPHLTDLTGLFSIASLLAALVLQMPRVKRLTKRYLAILTAAVFVVSLIPFGSLPLAGYVRGMMGDLSITTVVLAWAALSFPYCPATELRQRNSLLMLIAAAAIVFYPMTLGMSLVDPYRLGYSNVVFVACVLAIGNAAWFLRSNLIVLCLALATLAWSLGWYESTNLWDYLLDPLVATYAIGRLIMLGTKKMWFTKR